MASMLPNRIRALQTRMSDQLKKMDKLDPEIAQAEEVYRICLNNLNYATLVLHSHTQKMAELQDTFNELACELEDLVNNESNVKNDEDVCDDYNDDVDYTEIYDEEFWTYPKDRMTRKHVLTADEAIKAGKASKLHKLKPKKENRDITKTKVEKGKTVSKAKHSDAKSYKKPF